MLMLKHLRCAPYVFKQKFKISCPLNNGIIRKKPHPFDALRISIHKDVSRPRRIARHNNSANRSNIEMIVPRHKKNGPQARNQQNLMQ